jgi:hypothetical protein
MYDVQLAENMNRFNDIFASCQKRGHPWHG